MPDTDDYGTHDVVAVGTPTDPLDYDNGHPPTNYRDDDPTIDEYSGGSGLFSGNNNRPTGNGNDTPFGFFGGNGGAGRPAGGSNGTPGNPFSGSNNGFPFSGFPNPFTSPFTGPVNNLLGGVADYSGAPGLASHPALASMNMLTNGFPLNSNSYTPATTSGQSSASGDDSCYDILFDVVGPGPRYKGKLTFYDKKTGDEVASCEAISGCDSPVQYGTPYGSKFTVTNFSSPSFGNTRIFGPGQVISFKVSLSPSKLTDPQTGNDAGPFFIFPMSDNSNCTKGAIGVKGDYKQLKNIQDLLKACAKCGASLRVGTPQENSGPTPPPPARVNDVINPQQPINQFPELHWMSDNYFLAYGSKKKKKLTPDEETALSNGSTEGMDNELLKNDQVKRAIEQGKKVTVEYGVEINGEHVTKTDVISTGKGKGDFVIHVTGQMSGSGGVASGGSITIDIPGLGGTGPAGGSQSKASKPPVTNTDTVTNPRAAQTPKTMIDNLRIVRQKISTPEKIDERKPTQTKIDFLPQGAQYSYGVEPTSVDLTKLTESGKESIIPLIAEIILKVAQENKRLHDIAETSEYGLTILEAIVEIKKMNDAKRNMERAENNDEHLKAKQYEDEYKEHRDKLLEIATLTLLDAAFKKAYIGLIWNGLKLMKTVVEQDPNYWSEVYRDRKQRIEDFKSGRPSIYKGQTNYLKKLENDLDEAEAMWYKTSGQKKPNGDQFITNYYR